MISHATEVTLVFQGVVVHPVALARVDRHAVVALHQVAQAVRTREDRAALDWGGGEGGDECGKKETSFQKHIEMKHA